MLHQRHRHWSYAGVTITLNGRLVSFSSSSSCSHYFSLRILFETLIKHLFIWYLLCLNASNMFSVIEFVRFNFSAEEEVAAISEKVPDHKTIARLQLADAKDVLEGIQDVKGVSFPILTPNLKICYIYYHLLLDIRISLSTPVRKPRKLKIYK
ncbi:hypothetical protein HN873_005191 [Arachis hypogaea]